MGDGQDHNTTTASATPNSGGPFTVAVVITTYDHARFLAGALDSVRAQTVQPAEIVVVDDGSHDDPAAVLAAYPEARLITQTNQGLSAARNTGLHATSAARILFLDADDRLHPEAIASGLACAARHPDAALVYGAYRLIDGDDRPIGHTHYTPIGPDPYRDLLTGNVIGMHATVLYDRAQLAAAGGFDVSLRCCEDYDAYLRLARTATVASHPTLVADYRQHGANMSADHRRMLRTVLAVLDRQTHHARGRPDTEAALRLGRRTWRRYYADTTLETARRAQAAGGPLTPALMAAVHSVQASPRALPSRLYRAASTRLGPWPPPRSLTALPATARRMAAQRISSAGRTPRVPPPGTVTLGDLDRTTPLSTEFGFDRGTPVDRRYIDAFLRANADAIAGRALEVGDDAYCRAFGAGRVTHQDVLHVDTRNPDATIVGDLSVAGVLPAETFDCMVLTQTLHLIFDMPAAVAAIHRALTPGGTVLLTVPGITPIDSADWGSTWYWSLTEASVRRLFTPVFGPGQLTVSTFGNVYAATAFLHGLAAEEIDEAKLEPCDPCYPVIVAVRATRAPAAAGGPAR